MKINLSCLNWHQNPKYEQGDIYKCKSEPKGSLIAHFQLFETI